MFSKLDVVLEIFSLDVDLGPLPARVLPVTVLRSARRLLLLLLRVSLPSLDEANSLIVGDLRVGPSSRAKSPAVCSAAPLS